MSARYLHHDHDSETLVVLLHGLGGDPQNFVRYGTLEQIRDCRADASVLAAGSHFGYYRERIVIERLRRDVVEPALASGATEIWLLGVSLGGLGSLVYRQAHPDEVAGVILMAPYLGERDELEAWLADPAGYRAGDSPSELVDLWAELALARPSNAAITLAYGDADGFNRQHRWLAALLDPDKVLSAPGGHGWKLWRELWPRALRQSGLCSRPAW